MISKNEARTLTKAGALERAICYADLATEHLRDVSAQDKSVACAMAARAWAAVATAIVPGTGNGTQLPLDTARIPPMSEYSRTIIKRVVVCKTCGAYLYPHDVAWWVSDQNLDVGPGFHCWHHFKEEEQSGSRPVRAPEPLPSDWVEKGWVKESSISLYEDRHCSHPGCRKIFLPGTKVWRFRKPHGKVSCYCLEHYSWQGSLRRS